MKEKLGYARKSAKLASHLLSENQKAAMQERPRINEPGLSFKDSYRRENAACFSSYTLLRDCEKTGLGPISMAESAQTISAGLPQKTGGDWWNNSRCQSLSGAERRSIRVEDLIDGGFSCVIESSTFGSITASFSYLLRKNNMSFPRIKIQNKNKKECSNSDALIPKPHQTATPGSSLRVEMHHGPRIPHCV
ncbi:unnamed protein product [Notodromas monacha]|uniref:Uncharacterized protein n=1 Tax=Notodromas monacha TaxID=399045 RepID=A0A7R9GBJ6_9CRUS|nr:unnamed protein product [Notodromas monacha]CAG0915067.1 unnamed protein product [Notodromas monacha]